jgi:hypothetical protein
MEAANATKMDVFDGNLGSKCFEVLLRSKRAVPGMPHGIKK